MKKWLTVFLCFVLCLSLTAPALGTNSLGVTFSATLNTDTLTVSDSSQAVTLNISGSPKFDACAFAYEVEYPEGWIPGDSVSCTDFTISGGDYTKNFAENTSKVGWMDNDTEDHENVSDLGTLTFTVPANTPAGTYTFKVKNFEVIHDYGDTWESGSTLTASLTIKGGDVGSTGAKLDKTSASVGIGGILTLTPSLLPNNTSATISSVTWESSNTAIATVTGNTNNTGTVTGVVAGGPVTITAHVTANDNATPYDVTCSVTVENSPYTVSVKRDGGSTDPVHPGEDVTMKVSVTGESFNGLQAAVTYNKDLFTYKSYTPDITLNEIITSTAGEVSIRVLPANAQAFSSGTTVVTLVFTAKELTDGTATAVGTFGFADGDRSPIACRGGDGGNAETIGYSATDGDTVTIVKQYTVKFMNKDNEQIGDDILVDAGSKLTSVPDAPVVAYNDFDGWYDGKNTYPSADAIKALTISDHVTFKATYTAQSFSVTLKTGLKGSDTATYGTDYLVTVTDYDAANYVYTVEYTAGTDSKKTAIDNGNGTFTIPGTDITGALDIKFEKKVVATVVVHPDYVTGYTLITIASSGSKVYSYDGNPMYFISGQNEYAWLVEGSVSQTVASGKIGEATAAAGTITLSTDVNGDGKVNIADAVIVNSVLNLQYTVSTRMDLYLKANLISSDYVVDIEDVNAILTDSKYVK